MKSRKDLFSFTSVTYKVFGRIYTEILQLCVLFSCLMAIALFYEQVLAPFWQFRWQSGLVLLEAGKALFVDGFEFGPPEK